MSRLSNFFCPFVSVVARVVRHISFGHNKLPFHNNKDKRSTVPAFFLAYLYKFITYVVNFLLRFKPTNFSSFSIHKNSKLRQF